MEALPPKRPLVGALGAEEPTLDGAMSARRMAMSAPIDACAAWRRTSECTVSNRRGASRGGGKTYETGRSRERASSAGGRARSGPRSCSPTETCHRTCHSAWGSQESRRRHRQSTVRCERGSRCWTVRHRPGCPARRNCAARWEPGTQRCHRRTVCRAWRGHRWTDQTRRSIRRRRRQTDRSGCRQSRRRSVR
jgi:hypothetical protein